MVITRPSTDASCSVRKSTHEIGSDRDIVPTLIVEYTSLVTPHLIESTRLGTDPERPVTRGDTLTTGATYAAGTQDLGLGDGVLIGTTLFRGNFHDLIPSTHIFTHLELGGTHGFGLAVYA